MRDEDHRAFEVLERGDQHVLGRQVEVVGRLVQHEEIGRIEEHARHHEPRLLAAGERPDPLVDLVARELEGAQQAADQAHGLVREVLLQLLEDGDVRVQQIQRLLGEVAQLDAGADGDVARVGLQRAGHHAQQRRLARAVAAHDRPPLAALDRQVQAVVDHAPAVGLA